MILLKKIAAFIWSKKFAINFGILVILYVSIFVCLKWYLNSTTVFGEKIEVPNLIGKNQNNLNFLIPMNYQAGAWELEDCKVGWAEQREAQLLKLKGLLAFEIFSFSGF